MKEASELSGHDLGTLHWMIQEGAVDTRREKDVWLIERASLRESQESLLEVLRWFERNHKKVIYDEYTVASAAQVYHATKKKQGIRYSKTSPS